MRWGAKITNCSRWPLWAAAAAYIVHVVFLALTFQHHRQLAYLVVASAGGAACLGLVVAWCGIHVRQMKAREDALGAVMVAACEKLGVPPDDPKVTALHRPGQPRRKAS